MKILAVDDDPLILELLELSLTSRGHQVVRASDGQQALHRYQQNWVPLIITDRVMAGMDGLDLCRRIRALKAPRYTYIIMLTAIGGKQGFLTGLEAGADDFVTKPFDDEELAARIRVAERILGLQNQIRELEGLLPICSYCKRVRDDQQYWHQVEHFMSRNSNLRFTHGICPSCWETHVEPELRNFQEADLD